MNLRLIGSIKSNPFFYFDEFQSNEVFLKKESVRNFRILLLKRGDRKANRSYGRLGELGCAKRGKGVYAFVKA